MRGLLASGALIGYLLGACAKDFDDQSIAVVGQGDSAATCAFCVGNEGTCFGNPEMDACLTWYHAVCPDTCASVRPDSVGPATGAGVAGLDYSKDSDQAYSLYAKVLGNDIPACDGNQFDFFNCAADTMTNLFCPASCNAMFELDTCTGTTDTVGYADPQLGRSCEQWANACSRQNAGQIDDCSQISADNLVLNGLTSATCTPGGWLSDSGKYYAKSIMDDVRGNCPVACYTCHDDVNQPEETPTPTPCDTADPTSACYINSDAISKAGANVIAAAVGLGTGILVAVIVVPIVGLILLIICIVCLCKHCCGNNKPAA